MPSPGEVAAVSAVKDNPVDKVVGLLTGVPTPGEVAEGVAAAQQAEAAAAMAGYDFATSTFDDSYEAFQPAPILTTGVISSGTATGGAAGYGDFAEAFRAPPSTTPPRCRRVPVPPGAGRQLAAPALAAIPRGPAAPMLPQQQAPPHPAWPAAGSAARPGAARTAVGITRRRWAQVSAPAAQGRWESHQRAPSPLRARSNGRLAALAARPVRSVLALRVRVSGLLVSRVPAALGGARRVVAAAPMGSQALVRPVLATRAPQVADRPARRRPRRRARCAARSAQAVRAGSVDPPVRASVLAAPGVPPDPPRPVDVAAWAQAWVAAQGVATGRTTTSTRFRTT